MFQAYIFLRPAHASCLTCVAQMQNSFGWHSHDGAAENETEMRRKRRQLHTPWTEVRGLSQNRLPGKATFLTFSFKPTCAVAANRETWSTKKDRDFDLVLQLAQYTSNRSSKPRKRPTLHSHQHMPRSCSYSSATKPLQRMRMRLLHSRFSILIGTQSAIFLTISSYCFIDGANVHTMAGDALSARRENWCCRGVAFATVAVANWSDSGRCCVQYASEVSTGCQSQVPVILMAIGAANGACRHASTGCVYLRKVSSKPTLQSRPRTFLQTHRHRS